MSIGGGLKQQMLMEINIRAEVKKFGRPKARARARYFLSALHHNPVNAAHAEMYEAACQVVFGRTW